MLNTSTCSVQRPACSYDALSPEPLDKTGPVAIVSGCRAGLQSLQPAAGGFGVASPPRSARRPDLVLTVQPSPLGSTNSL
jgi:hypothetical protein